MSEPQPERRWSWSKLRRADKLKIAIVVFAAFTFITGAETLPEIIEWWQYRNLSARDVPDGQVQPVLVTAISDGRPDALMRVTPRCLALDTGERVAQLFAPSIAESINKHIVEANDNATNLWFVVGSDFSLDGQPYMLQLWNGYFYDVPMTFEQAAVMGTQPESRFWWDSPVKHGHIDQPRLVITELELHNLTPTFSVSSPIRGRMSYRVLTPTDEPLEIAGGFSVGKAGSTLMDTDYAGVADPIAGELEFEFDPLVRVMAGDADREDKVEAGPILVFFSIVQASTDKDAFLPIAHPIAVLLDKK